MCHLAGPSTRTPAPASDLGAPPIMVVGTTGDPVTPYSWAVNLAKELTGDVLLTWQGQSHVASFYSRCVQAAAQAYLLAGTLPPPGPPAPTDPAGAEMVSRIQPFHWTSVRARRGQLRAARSAWATNSAGMAPGSMMG